MSETIFCSGGKLLPHWEILTLEAEVDYVCGMVKGTVQGGYLPRAYPEEHPTFSAELHNFRSVSVHQEDLVIGGYVEDNSHWTLRTVILRVTTN